MLVSSGASALNQFFERRFDAGMRRTARRPLAAGKLEPASALRFGLLLSFTGAIYLAVAVNVLASLLAALTLVSYLALYTPLKRKTQWCTVAGAFSGAMPPLIGWAAASGGVSSGLSSEAWVLYAMLFLWQFPHFMAIAWMYRDDYARAGYLVLPRGEHGASFMSWQAMTPSLALLPVSMMAGAGGMYRLLACLASAVYVYFSGRLALERSNFAAKRLLMVSIIYAPLAFCLILFDKH